MTTFNRNIDIEDIFAEDGAIADFKEGYKPRPAQIEASKRINEAIKGNNNAIIEGGTGIGKSFAYLFPTLKNIAESNFKKKAVIVTSGISLQEQLVNKDLPFAVKVMSSLYPNWKKDFKFTLLKGKQNFICLEKAEEMGLTYLPKTAISESFHEVHDFIRQTKTGDLSDMNTVLDREVLELVTCSKKSECKGKECNLYNECYYTKHRKVIEESSIIVTNYHMLFSNIEVGGAILPDYDILVFDEAHEAANIFRDFDSQKLSVNTILNIRNKVSELNNKTKEFAKVLSNDTIKGYISDFELAFHELEDIYKDIYSPVTIDNEDMLPDSIYELEEKIRPLFYTADELSCKLQDRCRAIDDKESDDYKKNSEAARVLSVISELIYSIIDFIGNLKYKIADDNEVVYVEILNETIYIGSKKIEIGETLNSELFESENLSCIFTSATMSVAGSFEYIKEQIGIKFNSKKTIEFIANSPFDLTKQQLWYLPPNTCNGNEAGFDSYAASNMAEIIDACNGGTLCLFTSIRSMRSARMYLDRELGDKYRILSQGDMPKSKLVKEFTEDKDSVLLGTKSFFTGIDVPGDSLRCVIIDKFPFAQPTDPVQQKLKLKPNSFYKYSIPDMIILLKQAVGRGVRSIDDKCVVCILDGRMSTAKYKARIFNSFGYKKTATRDVEDIKSFVKGEN